MIMYLLIVSVYTGETGKSTIIMDPQLWTLLSIDDRSRK